MEPKPGTSSDYANRCDRYDGPSYSNLPMEIILKIFRYLNFYDVQSSSLTCRRWLEASESNEFQSKVLLKFSKPYLDDNTMPGELFVRTQRAYHNLLLDETTFGNLQQFFQTLSKTVEKLILISTDLTDKQFFKLVNQLSNVTDLTMENCSTLFMIGHFLKTEKEQDLIRDFLNRIKKLSLRKNQYLSDAILIRLTTLINGIEKLDLCGCHIAYHNAIQRRFYPPDVENIPNESILTFKYLLKVIERHASTINELDLSHTLIGGPALSALSSTVGLKLRKVKFNFCRQINYNGLDILTNYQKNIIELNISHSDAITDSCIQLITDNLVLLEKLYLRRCRKLTNSSLISISRLTNLKVLDISLCDGISTGGYLDGIVKNTRNTNLEELYIVAIDVCEQCIIQIAENLKNLRLLDIGHCVNGVTNHSVQSIITNLKLLRNLDMEGCTLISDPGLTGINIMSQQSASEFLPQNSSVSSIYIEGFYIAPQTPPIPESSISPPKVCNLSMIPYPLLEASVSGSQSISLLPPTIPPQQQQLAAASSNRTSTATSASGSTNSSSSSNDEEIVQHTVRENTEFNINKEFHHGVSLSALKGLQSLNLQDCKITDLSLEYGFNFIELRRVVLASCQISDIGIEYLVNKCAAIEDLDLSDCKNIYDKSIQYISQGLKRLRILNISGCKQLTNQSIDLIVINCNSLQSLSVNRCKGISTDSDIIMKILPSLRNINIDRLINSDNPDNNRSKTDPNSNNCEAI